MERLSLDPLIGGRMERDIEKAHGNLTRGARKSDTLFISESECIISFTRSWGFISWLFLNIPKHLALRRGRKLHRSLFRLFSSIHACSLYSPHIFPSSFDPLFAAQWIASLIGIIAGSVLLCCYQKPVYTCTAITYIIAVVFDLLSVITW